MAATTIRLDKPFLTHHRSEQYDSASIFASYYALPEQTRLLVAHCLDRDRNRLSLLNGDRDADALVNMGWLTPLVCPTKGLKEYAFKPAVWAQLSNRKNAILNRDVRENLDCYRQRKSAGYPWRW
jgi:hypothetical protein